MRDWPRNKVLGGLALLAFIALAAGWATFDQWSAFVGGLVGGLMP